LTQEKNATEADRVDFIMVEIGMIVATHTSSFMHGSDRHCCDTKLGFFPTLRVNIIVEIMVIVETRTLVSVLVGRSKWAYATNVVPPSSTEDHPMPTISRPSRPAC
jgi:hypothetical protein